MAGQHPIRLAVTDDLRRNRLTVFFRYLLAIPHLIVSWLWGMVAGLAAVVSWFATLFAGHTPRSLPDFIAGYLRYSTRVLAYQYLLADPFPPFSSAGSYPVDLEIDPPAPQSRWKTGFRCILAIPALLLATLLTYLLGLLGFLGWFACLFLGRMPESFERLGLYCLSYSQQTYGYLYLLTDRYPSLDSSTTESPAAGGVLDI